MTPYRVPAPPPAAPVASLWPARLRVLVFSVAGFIAILAAMFLDGASVHAGLLCIVIFQLAMLASGMWGPWR